MTFGTFLMKERQQHNLTQKEIATLINVSQSSYNSWESDINYPNSKYLPTIAKAFGFKVEQIVVYIS
jgi:transcriptional regulator with XRE-family HTH domain